MVHLKWIRRAVAIGVLVALAACAAPAPGNVASSTPPSEPSDTPSVTLTALPEEVVTPSQPPPQTMGVVAEASNAFGFDLLQQLRQTTPDENIFVSPLSLTLLLQIAYNGATGETAQEMAQVMHVDGTEPAAVNAASRALQDALRAAPDVDLLIANSVWVRQGYTLLDEFLQRVRDAFDAEATVLDFAAPDAVDRINAWVAAGTQGKIDKLFDTLDADVVAYLINTVYFKGAWPAPFDPARTQPLPFHLADGSDITLPMMSQEADFAVAQGDAYSALSLPYGDGRVQMVIVLPGEGTDLATVLDQFTPASWQGLLAQLDTEPANMVVTLPRFKLDYDAKLNDALAAMGMPGAFSEPDFADMVEGGGLWISYIRHRAVIEVNEEGTVAAAVSAGAMTLSMPPSFTVDHPFFFAIHDRETDTILFMGAVYQPEPLGN